MATQGEKLIFGFLGAMTAIVFGLAVFTDFQNPSERTPASQTDKVIEEPADFLPYSYLID